jgi:acyl-coenzyme A thioesterase PaaI-like protein
MTVVSDPSEPPTLAWLRSVCRSGRPVAAAHARLGVQVVEVDPGACTGRMAGGAVMVDDAGRLDLGSLLVLADAVLGIAVGSALPAGRRITTLSIRVSSVRRHLPRAGGAVARAALRALTDDSGVSSGTIEDAAGTLLARISSRCAVLPGESGAAPKEKPFAAVPLAASVAEAVGATEFRLDEQGAEVTGRATWEISNTGGIVQGGALGAFAEHAISRTLTAAVPALAAADAEDLELIYLRGVRADGGPMACRVTLQHTGGSFAVARAEVAGADGRTALLATGTRYAGRR